MDIDDLKKFTKTVRYNYIPLYNGFCDAEIKNNSSNILKINKTPSIVDLKKNYKDFDVFIEYQDEKTNTGHSKKDIEPSVPEAKKYKTGQKDCNKTSFSHILLVKSSQSFATMVFKYSYFTASEILDFYNIPIIASFQVIGHILHLNLRDEHLQYKKLIGELYLDKTNNIKTVICKLDCIKSVYRNIDYELLAGEDNLITTHIENNTKFYIDYKNVYWNGKLQSERKSLLDSIKTNETIADVFCGTGPITIQAIKRGITVYCNDLNPVAIDCVKKSVVLNKIDNPYCYNLDAKNFIEIIIQKNIKIDHFIMNLPEVGLQYIKYLQDYKQNFIVHNYFFHNNPDTLLDFVRDFCFFDIADANLRYIRKVSPKKDMYKLTVFVKNKND